MLQNVVITMLRGEFIAPAWREEGTVLEVDKAIADRWIAHGSARLGGDLGDARRASDVPTTHQLDDFPGAGLFAAAGFTTVAEVQQLVQEKGDAWPKAVKGMTKAIAAKVSEKLELLQATDGTDAQDGQDSQE